MNEWRAAGNANWRGGAGQDSRPAVARSNWYAARRRWQQSRRLLRTHAAWICVCGPAGTASRAAMQQWRVRVCPPSPSPCRRGGVSVLLGLEADVVLLSRLAGLAVRPRRVLVRAARPLGQVLSATEGRRLDDAERQHHGTHGAS